MNYQDFQNASQDLSQKITIDNHTNAREEFEVEATIEEWVNFIEEKNINGVLSVCAEDIVTFDLMAPLANHGIDELHSRLEKWFNSYEGDLRVEISELRISAERDTAFAHCLIRYQGTKLSKDEEGEDMYNRVSFGFEKIGHDWLIVHMHSSMPFDMKTMKIRTDLTPQ
jgi:ketosteroid isomerase-like protein